MAMHPRILRLVYIGCMVHGGRLQPKAIDLVDSTQSAAKGGQESSRINVASNATPLSKLALLLLGSDRAAEAFRTVPGLTRLGVSSNTNATRNTSVPVRTAPQMQALTYRSDFPDDWKVAPDVWDKDDQQYKKRDDKGRWRDAKGKFTKAPAGDWIPAHIHYQNITAASPQSFIKDSASAEAKDDQMQWFQMNGKLMQALRKKVDPNNINIDAYEATDSLNRDSTQADEIDEYTSPRLSQARSGWRLMKNWPEGSQIGPQKPEDVGKLTVVLDLDECLVHSLSSYEERKPNALDEIEYVRGRFSNMRPGLQRFLEAASKEFELMVYTSSSEDYARPLLDHLDPKGIIFRHRLYRDSCLSVTEIKTVYYKEGEYLYSRVGPGPHTVDSGRYFTKDLSRCNRPMSRILLVDNEPSNFVAQLQNGVPIDSFTDDADDTALTMLASLLERIKNEADVRPFLTKSFDLENLLRQDREEVFGEIDYDNWLG